jgi:phosphoglycerate dehydrogenase-like enzyme
VAGLDHIDQNYLKDNNIAFFSAQGCNAMAVAEFVISAIVNLADKHSFNSSVYYLLFCKVIKGILSLISSN